MKAGPISAPVDVPFNDVFDSLEVAFIVHFEALHKSNWGILVDVNYLDLENDMALPNGISQNVDLDLTVAETSVYYSSQHDAHRLDAILGLRYVEMENVVSLANGHPWWTAARIGWIPSLADAGSGALPTAGRLLPEVILVVSG